MMMENRQKRKWLRISLPLVFGLVLAGGLIWARIQVGKQRATLPTPTTTPTQFPLATSTPYLSPEPTLLPDETAGWKSYTNEEGGFEIEYPPAWFQQGNQILNYDPDKAPGREFDPLRDKGMFKVEIAVLEKKSVPNFQTLPLMAWIKEYRKKTREELYGTEFKPEEKFDSVIFNSLSGVRVETTGGVFAPFLSIYFGRGEEVFEITAGLDYKSEEETFNLMLSTFRFLE